MELYVFRISNSTVTPHLSYKMLYITKHYRKNPKTFSKFINNKFAMQRDGIYLLRNRNNKVMMRFRLVDGKVTQLWKNSPVTKERHKLLYDWNDK